VAGGDLIVCEVSIEGGPQVSAVSDTLNGGYTKAIAVHTNAALKQQSGIFFLPNAVTGNHNITLSWTGGPQPWVAMACQSWTGVAMAAAQDTTMTELLDGTSANPTVSSSLTPGVPGELVIGTMINGSQVPAAGQNYALTDPATTTSMWPEYSIQTSPTATNAPYVSPSDTWTEQMVAFKPLSSSVTPAPVINSAASASGTVGSSFSYQITATNTPTSYSATGLAAGLFINPLSGIISGTPTAAGTSTIVVSATNGGGTGNANLALTIAAPAPVLSSLSCSTASMTGAATDACTVALTAAAPSGGFTVALASNNSAVVVPASVTVAAGAASASFSAAVSSVTTTQAVTVSANAGSVATTVALQLNAAISSLSLSSSSLSFSNVYVNSSATQSITLSSTGTVAVTVNSATLAGAGYSISGASFPMTLNPNQTTTLTVQFAPTSAGASNGTLTIASNSTTNGTSAIALSATGLPVLTGISCTNASMTGSGTDACTVSLNAAAASGGFPVNLTSSNSAVTVPASVTVAAGATSASFTATIASVTTAQAVTVSATAGIVDPSFAIQLNAAIPTLTVSSSSVSFGNVNVNTPTTQTITLSSTGTAAVTINSATPAGTGFSISGASFPLTLNPNQTATLTIAFNPTSAGAASGTLTIASNSTTNGTAAIALTGTGLPVLTGISCSSSSMTGAGTDACTVSLNTAAASGGFPVNLASNNSAVTVPASVTVAAGATSAAFTATIASVSSSQAVMISATAGLVDPSFALQLNAAVPTLTVSSSSVTFGNVNVNTAATQSITLSSTGTASVTISSATLAGTGFSISGASFPLTLSPNQTTTLAVAFNPTSAGAVSGTLTIASSSSTNGSAAITLSGIGLPVLTGISCSNSSMTGAGTDACTVSLNTAAASGGFTVNLASSNTAITVPASVTIASGAASASFSATTTAVTATQTVTLTATAGSASQTAALQLNPVVTSTIRRNAHVVVDAGGNQSASPFSVTLPNVAAGDLIVCEASIEGGPQVTSVSDANGVYSPAVPMHTNTAFNQQTGIFFIPNATAGSHSISLAWTGAAQPWVAMACQSWTGAAIAAPQDVTMTQQLDGSSIANPATGSAKTPAVAGELVIANLINAAQIPTAGQNYALTDSATSTYMWPEYSIQTAATATNAPYVAATDNWTNQMAAFKPLTAGASAPVISSATSASGAVGSSFAYQITASNTPTSYGATGLPAGLTVNSSTGLISGTPTAAGASTVALTATNGAGTGNASLVLTVTAAAPALSVNATSIAFGTVSLSTPSTQSVTLTSTGSAPVTVSSATVSGSGFSVSGATFPLTLSPNQTATLSVQFDPTTAGAATGQLTIASNATTNSTANVSLSGTGQGGSYGANITWNAPTGSSDPVAAYNVYRSPSGSSSYQLLSTVASTQLAFMDNGVQVGQTYNYVVESVDPSGNESAPSNMASVTIP
jgi:hypothetical protein